MIVVDKRDSLFTIETTLLQLLDITKQELADTEDDEQQHLLEHLKKSLDNAAFYAAWLRHNKENM